MLSSLLLPVLVFFLASTSVGALMLAALYPRVARAGTYRQRFDRVAGRAEARRTDAVDEDARDRRRSVEKTLREIDAKANALKNGRPKLGVRLRQAGLDWSTRTYWLVSAGAGLATYLTLLLPGLAS